MGLEQQSSAEIDPAAQALEAFLASRREAGPVETYDEFLAAFRGEVNVPMLLADYVKRHGEIKVAGGGEASASLTVQAGKHRITATVKEAGTEHENVEVYARRRTLPLFRYKETKLLFLTRNPAMDQVVIRHPRFEVFQPYGVSPDYVNFWVSKGEHLVQISDGATTAAQIARESLAKAHTALNGFLDETAWLVDGLLHPAAKPLSTNK